MSHDASSPVTSKWQTTNVQYKALACLDLAIRLFVPTSVQVFFPEQVDLWLPSGLNPCQGSPSPCYDHTKLLFLALPSLMGVFPDGYKPKGSSNGTARDAFHVSDTSHIRKRMIFVSGRWSVPTVVGTR
jgi:hypothetical protein